MTNEPTWSGVLHAGIYGFLRSPVVPPRRDALRAASVTHAIYGIPFDSTTLYRTGSMHGPKAVRDASIQFVPYHFDYDVDLTERLTLVDCGDANALPGNAARTLDIAVHDLEEIYAADAMPIVLGGEHTVTIAGTRALAAHAPGPLGLVVFDTHLDTAADIGGEQLTYCAPVSRTLDLSSYSPPATALIGVHGPANPREEREWAERMGVRVYSVAEIERRGIVEVTREAMARAWDGTCGVYVSVDIDVLDAAYNPGGAPEPGGLTTRELFAALRVVGEAGYSAFDVVEIAPQYDPAGITAITACRVILDLLAAGAAAEPR